MRFSLLPVLFFIVGLQSSPAVPDDWTKPLPPFQISGNLYYVGSRDLASYLVVTSAGNILINANLESSPALIRVSVEKLGFKWADTKILLSSQAHYEVVPADYAVRATPLAVGHHLIRFEYVPTGLRAGLAISALAWAGWLALWASRPVRRHPV